MKVFIYLCILALMFVAFGIRHADWSMYQGYLTVFLLSWKTAFWWLSLVTSGMWPLPFVLWSQWWLNTINIGICSCMNEATKVTQHHLHGYGHPIFFGCALRFNPWYVDFISGPSSCENQTWLSWLIVELLSLLQVKIGLIRDLLFVAYSILLGCYVLWPSLQLL